MELLMVGAVSPRPKILKPIKYNISICVLGLQSSSVPGASIFSTRRNSRVSYSQDSWPLFLFRFSLWSLISCSDVALIIIMVTVGLGMNDLGVPYLKAMPWASCL